MGSGARMIGPEAAGRSEGGRDAGGRRRGRARWCGRIAIRLLPGGDDDDRSSEALRFAHACGRSSVTSTDPHARAATGGGPVSAGAEAFDEGAAHRAAGEALGGEADQEAGVQLGPQPCSAVEPLAHL